MRSKTSWTARPIAPSRAALQAGGGEGVGTRRRSCSKITTIRIDRTIKAPIFKSKSIYGTAPVFCVDFFVAIGLCRSLPLLNLNPSVTRFGRRLPCGSCTTASARLHTVPQPTKLIIPFERRVGVRQGRPKCAHAPAITVSRQPLRVSGRPPRPRVRFGSI